LLAIVAALGWLTYWAWLANRGDEPDKSQTLSTIQGEIAIAGGISGSVVQSEHTVVMSGSGSVTIMQPVKKPPPPGSAPNRLPRAAAFVERAETLAAFSATLRNEVALEQLTEKLLAVVQETMQPAQVPLWLRPPERHPEEPAHRLESYTQAPTKSSGN
jgi:hypothetical protein